MSQPIVRLLDENTANKIAAGEVVERPASVVKELVENALDAYSRNIEIAIIDGGTTFIRVTDDGLGMSRQDAELAVLRHATSKISSVEDLYNVHSLGFRGEALPSIASVSRFSLTTRLHAEHLATYVEVTGGVITDVREAGGGVGTTVIVADLFYNTPARRKFLKAISTESGYIHDALGKLALSHPEVGFKLTNNQRLVLSTPGSGELLDAITSLYGLNVQDEVLPVDYEGEDISISGYVAKPTLLKSSRQWQTFIVNGRTINSRFMAKALDNAYHSLLPKAGYPLAILNIIVPSHTVDVNVHPQKSEIKFSDESKVFKAMYRAISDALNSPDTRQASASPQLPKTWGETVAVRQYYNPEPDTRPVAPQPIQPIQTAQNIQLWREEGPSFTVTRETIRQQEEALAGIEPLESNECNTEAEMLLMPLGQIDDCYLIARGADGLYIIDQHAAHERILYERLSQATGRIPAQQLLMPLLLDFDTREIDIISEYTDLFYELGFTLEMIGPNTMRLTESPSDIAPAEARGFLEDILQLIQNTQGATAATIRHAYLQTAACRGAIKAGEVLNMRQIQALLGELSSTKLPYTCPHGRPTAIKFTPAELAKMFKRT